MEVRISIDDGRKEMIQVADLLDKYGLTGVFYIAPFDGLNTLKVREIQELSKRHEVGGHTLYHTKLTRVSLAEAKLEVEKGKKELEDIIGKTITKFAYPRGWYNKDVAQIVWRAGFDEARTMKMGVTDRSCWDELEIPVTAQNYPRAEYTLGIENAVRDIFDKAKNEDGYFNFVIHTDDIIRFRQWEMIENIFRYIAKNKK